MTKIRTDYSPYSYRRAMANTYRSSEDPGVGIPSGILSDSSFLYGDKVRLPGILGIGQEFLGKIMPVNERAILENQARGLGIYTDDIGRIVAGPGDINTAQNIMAGYNLAKIDAETFAKRRRMIDKYMKDKAQKDAKLKALAEAEALILGKATDQTEDIMKDQGKITQKQIEQMAKEKRDIQQYTGGDGNNNSSGSKGSKSSSKNSSQAGGSFNELGFSDIRLKENVELIGKSPSNINIYKFNYKDNPITYQGVMAHEVPWANIKHSNGYMMVDYNKVDVEFKKWQK